MAWGLEARKTGQNGAREFQGQGGLPLTCFFICEPKNPKPLGAVAGVDLDYGRLGTPQKVHLSRRSDQTGRKITK